MGRRQRSACFGVADLGADEVIGTQPQTFDDITAAFVVDQQFEHH